MFTRILSVIVMSFLVFSCSSSEEVVYVPVENNRYSAEIVRADISPKTNADGNYNIIFILVDQQHYFKNYPIGSSYKARELLEKLGTTFEKHYITTNMSTSSRSVIYTGQHVIKTTMLDNTDYPWQDVLPDNVTTIGDLMRKAGYKTAYKGKFHMGDLSIINIDNKTELQKQDDLEKYGFSDWNAQGDYLAQAQDGYFEDSSITGNTIDWIRKTGLETNKNGKSFFLAVNYINPHDIMYFNTDTDEDIQWKPNLRLKILKASDTKDYKKTYPFSPLSQSTFSDDINSPSRVQAHREYLKLWDKSVGHIPNEKSRWESFRDFYYNSIQLSDNQLMVLLKEIIDLKLLDNTIIIFTSDHGEMQGTHGGIRGKAGFIYENNINVPLTIYHPESLIEQRVKTITSHLDIAPTVVSMANINAELKSDLLKGLSGGNMMKLINHEETSIRKGSLFLFEMFSAIDGDMNFIKDNVTNEIVNANIDLNKRGFIRGLITEKYKFARYFSPLNFNTPTTIEELYLNNDIELYNLEDDPEEVKNLAADKDNSSILIMSLNTILNEVIAKEIGIDDGKEAKLVIEFIQNK